AAHDRQGSLDAPDGGSTEPERQDGRIASSAHQTEVVVAYLCAAYAVRCELVRRTGAWPRPCRAGLMATCRGDEFDRVIIRCRVIRRVAHRLVGGGPARGDRIGSAVVALAAVARQGGARCRDVSA